MQVDEEVEVHPIPERRGDIVVEYQVRDSALCVPFSDCTFSADLLRILIMTISWFIHLSR
jgi:hypothetical protein